MSDQYYCLTKVAVEQTVEAVKAEDDVERSLSIDPVMIVLDSDTIHVVVVVVPP